MPSAAQMVGDQFGYFANRQIPPQGTPLTQSASMSVIPLTLTISLCLVFTFVIFFLREHSRQRFSSAESEALLPLADETPRLARRSNKADSAEPSPTAESITCACIARGDTPCGGCQRRREAVSR